MSRKTLYIITGLPYSGKTTLRNEIVKHFGFPVVSVDEFLDTGNYIVEKMNQRDWNKVYSQAYKKLNKSLSNEQSIIFDGGSLLKSERDTLKDIATKNNTLHKLIYVKTPKSEIKKRWLKNQKTNNRDHVEAITMKKAFKMFEEPGKDEEAIIYKSSFSVKKWIDKYIM